MQEITLVNEVFGKMNQCAVNSKRHLISAFSRLIWFDSYISIQFTEESHQEAISKRKGRTKKLDFSGLSVCALDCVLPMHDAHTVFGQHVCQCAYACCFVIVRVGSPNTKNCFDPVWIRRHHLRSAAADKQTLRQRDAEGEGKGIKKARAIPIVFHLFLLQWATLPSISYQFFPLLSTCKCSP